MRILHRQPLASSFAWAFVLAFADRGQTFASQRSGHRGGDGLASTNYPCEDKSFQSTIDGEVVGASGRMGSFFLRSGSNQSNNSTVLVAVPRGVAPGCLSAEGDPIIVTTPSHSWSSVLYETIPERRSDLVLVGNGLPLDAFENCTIVIPHYGVLKVGEDPVTSLLSPPTRVYGKHSLRIQQVLEKHGIATKILDEWSQVRVAAAQKLMWAASMWLFCHSSTPPISVSQVHTLYRNELEGLVRELSPILQELTGQQTSVYETLEYMEQYSLSMANAIPSKDLAALEVKERNGVWLRLRHKFAQPLHEELLARVGGPAVFSQATRITHKTGGSKRIKLELNDASLTLWGVRSGKPVTPCRRAVVIGAGIIGSCTALNLARLGVNVTVYDRLPPKDNVGATTPASWAWINANGKVPHSYELLNLLGLRSWKYDRVLSSLPEWSGSLVASETEPNGTLGGYLVEGPLTPDRIRELEPQAVFSPSSKVYYYPEEGSVNPSTAVEQLHRAATELGVTFTPGEKVTNLTRDDEGRCITGVVTHSLSSNTTSKTSCDVVIVAAGIGSSDAALGGVPLLHRPGQSLFCRTQSSSSSQTPQLRRILVDTVRKAHVLQRRDGVLAVGGGVLETGGSPTTKRNAEAAAHESLLQGASMLAPRMMQDLTHSWLHEAVRPIPKDGLPSVGWLQPGLYGVVTHSGVTLAPLLGALASVEVTQGVACDILKPFRPNRFFRSSPVQQNMSEIGSGVIQ